MSHTSQLTSILVDRASRGHAREILQLLTRDLDLVHEQHETLGYSALHAAAEFGQLHVVVLLVEQFRAKVNIQSVSGQDTPLHRASAAGRLEVATTLLEFGADRTIENDRGETALDLALAFQKQDLVQLLGEAPTKPDLEVLAREPTRLDLTATAKTCHVELPIESFELEFRRLSTQEGQDMTETSVPNQEHDNEKQILKDGTNNHRSEGDWIGHKIDVVPATPEKPQNLTEASMLFSLRHLQPATTYEIQVRAKNRIGWGDVCPRTCIQTQSTVPLSPTTLECLAMSSRSLKIAWTRAHANGATVLNYQVRYSSALHKRSDPAEREDHQKLAFGPWTILNLDISRNLVTMNYLESDQVYRVSVRARNHHGWSDWSEDESAIFQTASRVHVEEREDPAQSQKSLVPVPPSRLVCVHKSCHELHLKWYQSSFSTSYDLRMKKNKTSESWTLVENLSTPRVQLRELEPHQGYVISLRSKNEHGVVGPWSRECNVIYTNDERPSAPTSPIPDFVTAHSVALSWTMDNDSSTCTYEVRVGCIPGQDDPRFDTGFDLEHHPDVAYKLLSVASGIAATKYVVQDLMPATSYIFVLRARNKMGWGPFSTLSKDTAVMTMGQVPLPPLAYTVSNIKKDGMDIRWEAPRYTGFELLQYEMKCIFESDLIKGSTQLMLPQALGQPPSSSNSSSSSSIVHPSFIGYTLARECVHRNNTTSPSTSPIFHQYLCHKSTLEASWQTLDATISGASLTYVVKGLKSSCRYFFQLRAKNQLGWGLPTPINSLPSGKTLVHSPEAPVGLLCTIATKHSLLIRWDPPYDNGLPIDEYRVHRRLPNDEDRSFCETTVVPHHCQHLLLDGLLPGTGYDIAIEAHNTQGWGRQAHINVYTKCDIPDSPDDIQALVRPHDKHEQPEIQISWTKPYSHGAEIQYYQVDCYETQERVWRIASSKIAMTDFTFSQTTEGPEEYKLLSGRTYILRVRALNAVGWGPYSSQQIEIIIDASPPYPPAIPNVIDSTTTSMTVVWDIPTHDGGLVITQYEIQCSSTGGVGAREEKAVERQWQSLNAELSTTMFIAFDLQYQRYVFRVRAKNALGWSIFSPESPSGRFLRRF